MNDLSYLDTKWYGYELVKLWENVHTAQETALAVWTDISQILKSILVQNVKDRLKTALIVILWDKKIDFKKINKVCWFQDTRFAPVDVVNATWFQIWTLPPWWYHDSIPIYFDKEILNKPVVYAWSWTSEYLIKFNPNQLLNTEYFFD